MVRSRLPLAAFSACSLIWGSTFLAIRIGNDSMPPIWSLALRLSVASLLFLAILGITKTKLPSGIALRQAMIFGFLEFGISMPSLYWAEKSISSGLAALLYATCPITAMFLGALFGQERLTWAKVGAGAAGLVGLAVIFGGQLGQGTIAGVVFAFVAAFSAVAGNIALKIGPPQSPFTSNAIAALMGVVLCLIISAALGEKWAMPSTIASAGSIVYLAVFGSVVAFTLAVWLLSQWQTSTVSFLGVICPMIAVVLGAVFRHETITPTMVVGGVVVLFAVLFALRLEAMEKHHEDAPIPL